MEVPRNLKKNILYHGYNINHNLYNCRNLALLGYRVHKKEEEKHTQSPKLLGQSALLKDALQLNLAFLVFATQITL